WVSDGRWAGRDTAAPSNPTSCSDSAGSSNNTWQNSITDPNFTWSGHSDSLSGVAGFYYYWGTDPNGTSTNYTTSAGYDPSAVSSDGVYYLRVQTRDAAGNTSSWTTIYTFKLDRQAPSNPTSCSDSAGSSNNTWQNSITDPNFSWSGASDSLSGVAGYYYYWGTDASGTSTNYTTSAAYDPPAVSSDGVYYLRVQTKDVAGNTSAWATVYTFKLDRGAPSGSATSPSSTWSPQSSITLSCSDSLSGVSAAKYNWDSPADAATGTSYSNGQTITAPEGVHTLYLWVKDAAGNTSTWSGIYYTDTTAPSLSTVSAPKLTSEPLVSFDLPADLSGLAGIYYKVGSAPTSPTDGYFLGPVLELRLDEGTGTSALDTSGFGAQATVSGATWTAGKFGSALSFDAVDDYVQLPYYSTLQPDSITISFWIKLTSDPDVDENNNWRWILSPTGSRAPCFLILEQNRTVNFTVYVGGVQYRYIYNRFTGTRIFSGEQLTVGEWTHLTYVYDASTGWGYAYKNGVLSRAGPMDNGSVQCPGGPLTKSSDYGWRISWPSGTANPNGNGCLPGVVDEFRIYNRALSDEEIQLLYFNRVSGPTLCLNFNEGSGSKALDSSGRGIHGTLYNGPSWTDGKFGKALSFDGVDDYVRTGTITNPFTTEQTIALWIKPNPADNVYGVTYYAKDYDGNTGEDYVDGSTTVRRAVVGTHPAGYLCDGMNVPAGFNGPFALTTYTKVADNTQAVVAWTVEVYEDGNLKWSYSRNANSYSNTTSYSWYESPTWWFDGSKSYTIKVYWPANVTVYFERVSIMGRRGGVGYGGTYPGSLLLQKSAADKLQVGYYTRKSDGTYSYTWFSSGYYVPVDGNWHHVAVTLKEGVKSLYIDGELKQQVTGCGDLYPSNTYFQVNNIYRNFWGLMDEVYIFNRALTYGEIYQLFSGWRGTRFSLPSSSAAATSATVYVWGRDMAGNANHASAVAVSFVCDPTLPKQGLWVEGRGGSKKTGYTPASPPVAAAGYSWVTDIFAELSSYTSQNHLASPAVADTDGDGKRELLFGSRDGKLYCIREGDKSVKWSFNTGGEVYSTPLVVDLNLDGTREIVFSSADGKIYCIRDSGSSATTVWTYNLGYFAQAVPTVANLDSDQQLELVLNTGFPWVTSESHTSIIAFANPGVDNSVLWTFSTPGNVYGSPAVADVDGDGKPEVVFGCLDGKVYIRNGEDGSECLTINFGSKIFVSTPIIENGDQKLILVCGWDKVACYSSSGTKLWENTSISRVQGNPAVARVNNDLVAFIPTRFAKTLYAVRCDTGQTLWSFTANNPILSSVTVADLDADGVPEVLFGTDAAFAYGTQGENGALYILNAATGQYFKGDQNQGKKLTKGCVRSEPVVADWLGWDGIPEIMFNGYMDNRIYLLTLKDPLDTSPPVGEVYFDVDLSPLQRKMTEEGVPPLEWMSWPGPPEEPPEASPAPSEAPPEAPAPPAEKLQSPRPSSVGGIQAVPPALSWEPVSDAEGYELQISVDEEFQQVLVAPKLYSTFFDTSSLDLEPGRKYYWRIRSLKAGTASEWSESQSFALAMETPIPSGGTGTVSSPPTLSWQEVRGAILYEVELSTDPEFSIIRSRIRTPSLSLDTSSLGLEPGEYYWRVRALSAEMSSEWSLAGSFRLQPSSAPERPVPQPSPAPAGAGLWVYLSALGIVGGVGLGWFLYSRRGERTSGLSDLREVEQSLRERILSSREEALRELNERIERAGAGRVEESLPALPGLDEELRKLERLRRRLD
ncbi:MAG: LamG-like jellyroll fold domain-containing protein, partial [Candidatus Hadarchaeales archaeon]